MRSKLGIGEFSGSSRTIPSVPQGETLFRITGKEEKKEIIKNLKEEIRELKKQLDQARKGNKEEYETASRAMLSFIDQRLTKEAGEEMGPHMIKSLIAQVNKAASTNKLKEPLNLVEKLIRVNESVLDRADFRSILAHEVQHTVQSIEGFARGGNSMTYRKHLDALKEKRDAWSMIEDF
jgi:uncharacterized protein with von Willebrand factor type A (vWA) domain